MKVHNEEMPPEHLHGTTRQVVMDGLRSLTQHLDDVLDGFLAESGPGSSAKVDASLFGDRGEELELEVSVTVIRRAGGSPAGRA